MTGLEARAVVETELRRELFGPSGEEPKGNPIDCSSGSLKFETAEASRGQFIDAITLEEILTNGDPLRRYGIGVLNGGASIEGTAIIEDDVTDLDGVTGIASSEDDSVERPPEIAGILRQDVADSDDFDLADANKFKPSAMAISFECRVPGGSLEIAVTGAYYDKIDVEIPGVKFKVEWWLRRPFELRGTIPDSVAPQRHKSTQKRQHGVYGWGASNPTNNAGVWSTSTGF